MRVFFFLNLFTSIPILFSPGTVLHGEVSNVQVEREGMNT